MSITEWRVKNLATGEVADVRLSHKKRPGRKPRVKTLHDRMTKAVWHPAPRNSVRFMIDGRECGVLAGGVERVPFSLRVERHHGLLKKRGRPIPAEIIPPTGQAAGWYWDVIDCVPRSGQNVARQVARLCGDDSQVTVSVESLSDAVGVKNKAGRTVSYTKAGVKVLIEAGWLRVEVTGPRGDQETTYFLTPGDRGELWFPEDDDEWEAVRDPRSPRGKDPSSLPSKGQRLQPRLLAKG